MDDAVEQEGALEQEPHLGQQDRRSGGLTCQLGPAAWVLRGFALNDAPGLMDAIRLVIRASPLRRLRNPDDSLMDVAVSNCGVLGWENEGRGYGYSLVDPLLGRPWLPMPSLFCALASSASKAAGFGPFDPQVCIINQYAVGAGLRMHQDRNDARDDAPVVSVSLGLPAMFRFGGQGKKRPVKRVSLHHGDVAVWGGTSRMARHGIEPIAPGNHAITGPYRWNLTFRSARVTPAA